MAELDVDGDFEFVEPPEDMEYGSFVVPDVQPVGQTVPEINRVPDRDIVQMGVSSQPIYTTVPTQTLPTPSSYLLNDERLVTDLNYRADPDYEVVRNPDDEALEVPLDPQACQLILESNGITLSENEPSFQLSSQASSVLGGHYLRTESSHSLHVSSQDSFTGMHLDSPAGSQPTSFASMPIQEPLFSQPIIGDHETP